MLKVLTVIYIDRKSEKLYKIFKTRNLNELTGKDIEIPYFDEIIKYKKNTKKEMR